MLDASTTSDSTVASAAVQNLDDVHSLGLSEGSTVGLLMRREERLQRSDTRLVACWPRVIILDAPALEGSELPGSMTIVSEQGEEWVSTNVRITNRYGAKIVGAIQQPWSRLNRRRHARMTLDLPVKLMPRGARTLVNGRLLDISFGGAAVEVRGDFEWTRLRLRVARNGYLTHLDCDVVGSRTGKDRTTVLHLAFRNASAENYDFLRSILGSEDGDHAVEFFRRRGVDGGDPGVRHRAVQDRAVEHAGQPDVAGEFCLPGQLEPAVGALHALSDDAFSARPHDAHRSAPRISVSESRIDR